MKTSSISKPKPVKTATSSSPKPNPPAAAKKPVGDRFTGSDELKTEPVREPRPSLVNLDAWRNDGGAGDKIAANDVQHDILIPGINGPRPDEPHGGDGPYIPQIHGTTELPHGGDGPYIPQIHGTPDLSHGGDDGPYIPQIHGTTDLPHGGDGPYIPQIHGTTDLPHGGDGPYIPQIHGTPGQFE